MRAARTLAWAAVLLLATAGAVRAAGRPVSLDLKWVGSVVRTGAPVLAEAKLANNTPSLIEGHLELNFRDGMDRLGTYASWDMALAPGTQRVRFMLPQFAPQGAVQSLTVRARFVTEHDAVDLGPQWLPVSAPNVRGCPTAMCMSDLDTAAPRTGRLASTGHAPRMFLSLAAYAADRTGANGRALVGSEVSLAPEDLPENPLGYCAFDIVVLFHHGLSMASRRQLDALAAWAEAGGSVFVLLPEGTLRQYHVDFLNRLASGPTFTLSADGLTPAGADSPSDELWLHRCGLGRAAIILRSPGHVISIERWREAVAFLWKVRKERGDEFIKDGTWHTGASAGALPHGGSTRLSRPDSNRLLQDFMGVQPLSSATNFYQALMPGSVRLIPVGWIALLLVLFVVAIGPGDYVLLGLIRRRKLTWVLFPALCIGFTLCMVAMARHYLGTNEQRGAYVFVDLGPGGRVLRTSRYELVYSASESTVDTRYSNAIASPLDPSMFVRAQYNYGYGPGYYPQTQMSEPMPPAYAGRLPGDYVLRRRRRQWVPQLTRTLKIGGKGPDLGLHWDAVRVADLRSRNITYVRAELTGGSAFDGDICVLDSRVLWVVSKGRAGLLQAVSARDNGPSFTPDTFLRDVACRPANGLFSVVSQVSPTGAGNFEDLSMLDPTDPNEWVVMAVKKVGDDYVICRRLYSGGP